jgi:hypothetical protein
MIMKGIALVGVILIVLGGAGVLYGGITYWQDKDTTDLGIGTVTVTHDKRWDIAPGLGAVLLAAGVIVLLFAARKRAST